MLTILFLLIWRSVATVHGYIQSCSPSNIAIALLRTRGGLKWAIPAALVAVPAYLCVAWLMTVLVDQGASHWLLLLTLVCFIDACKFGALALLVPLMLLRARLIRA